MTEAKKRGPKAKTLTTEQIVELKALAQYLTQAQIADYFSVSERTLHNIFDREPDIYAAYKKGAINAVVKSASILTKIAWGYKEFDDNGAVVAVHPPDRASLMFHLKCRGGWRETAHLEVTGRDGKDLTPSVDWSKVPTDVIQAVLTAQAIDNDDTKPEPHGLH